MKPSQKERIYSYVLARYREDGYAPSIRQIAAALGLTAPANISRQLSALAQEGRLVHLGGKYIPAAEARTAQVSMVPLLGQIAAGRPIEAVENLEGYVAYLPRSSGAGAPLFALRVRGDSMVDAGIRDGDIVVVEQTAYAENGQIVAAMLDGEATVKTFYKENGHYRLQPQNPALQPIVVDEVYILGRVVSSLRYY